MALERMSRRVMVERRNTIIIELRRAVVPWSHPLRNRCDDFESIDHLLRYFRNAVPDFDASDWILCTN